MDVLGTAIPIPESLAGLRSNQRYTYLRHICTTDLDCYGFLAFLLGVIDTGDIGQLSQQVLEGLMRDQRCAALLQHCRLDGNGILLHHRFRYFKEIKETLRLAAVRMREITQNSFEHLGIPFEHQQSGLLPGAKFGVFTWGNDVFTVYRTDSIQSDTMLCCGCRYPTYIYQQYTEADFPNFCPHHDREVLRRMLWDLTPEPCEEALEGSILSGQPLSQCQMCPRRSFTAVLTDVCGKGCSFCLDCLGKETENYKQMCPNCGTALRREKLGNIPEWVAPKLRELQMNVCNVLNCQYCGTATSYPLFFLGLPHASCYWCAACYRQTPNNCRACGGPYTSDEAAVLDCVNQGDCPLCFSKHTCETTCLLCTSVEQYKEHFKRQDCGLCGADLTTMPCQGCNINIRLKNLQLADGYSMCINCIAKYQPPPVPAEPQPLGFLPIDEPLRSHSRPSHIEVSVLADTLGRYEEVPNGCKKCGCQVSDDLYHVCSKQEGQCCLWCFAKLALEHSTKDYCPFCYTPTCKVLDSNPKTEFSLYCEICRKPANWRSFFHRSRCGEHITCEKCACKRLKETNGLNACPQCNPPNDPFKHDACSGCGNPSSSFIHIETTNHFLCWNCALARTPETAATCDCDGHLTDSFREALLIEKGSACSLCKRRRPLYEYRCGCGTKLCVECIQGNPKCPQCSVIKSLPGDWMETQKANCVGCLNTSPAIPMNCGHYCHRECYNRVGDCPFCSARSVEQPVNP